MALIRGKALAAADAAVAKKAGNVILLDMQDISPLTDYFVICSGATATQVQAISDHVQQQLKQKGCRLLRREGYRNANWVLLDYGDFIVHVFLEEYRKFYDLERLWGDAARIEIQ